MSEKLQILEMIEAKKISAEEGLELLRALELGGEETKEDKKKAKWLKITVREGDETNVDVNIPLALVKMGVKFAGSCSPELEGIDISEKEWDEIIRAAEKGEIGDIVNVDSNGSKVKIFLE